MAYTLAESGSDWKAIHVLAVDADGSPHELQDKCKLVRFSCLTWTMDGVGFFYCKCAALLCSACCARMLCHITLSVAISLLVAARFVAQARKACKLPCALVGICLPHRKSNHFVRTASQLSMFHFAFMQCVVTANMKTPSCAQV